MIDRRTAAVLFTIVVFVFGLGFIYEARRPLVLLIFSALFAYLLEPLVTWFQARLGDSRTKAIAATYVTLLLGISIFLSIAGPGIVHQSAKLVEELPKLIEQLGTGDIAQQIGSSQGWNYETQLRLQEFLRAHRDSIDQFLQIAIAKIPGLATYLLWLVLIPLFAAFFLKGKSDFANAFVSLIEGRPNRRFVRAVLDDLDLMLAAFIRAQLSLCGLSLVAYTLVLGFAHFPFSFAIAAIAAIFEFVPLLGALASGTLIMSIAVVTGYKHWLAILVFLLIWRGLQDYLNSPLLMGRGLELHPFAVIFGVLVSGELAGVAGVFLSVPVMAGLRIIWKNWEKRRTAITRNRRDSEEQLAG